MQFGSTGRYLNSQLDSGPLSPPNASATRSKIIRKPTAPLSSSLHVDRVKETISSPLSIDDATGTATSGLRTHPTPAIEAQLQETRGAVSGPSIPTRPKLGPMRAFRNSFLGKQMDDEHPPDPPRSKGKCKVQSNTDVEIQHENEENKLSAKARAIREWMMGKSGSEMHRAAIDEIKKREENDDAHASFKTRHRVGGVRDLFKNRKPPHPPKDRGPRPGQTYEIINRQIIESNPERTVEISTWREKPAEQAKSNDEERISIYYLSANEYPQEGDFAANEAVNKVEWRVDALDVPPEGQDCSQTGFGKTLTAERTHKQCKNSLSRVQPPFSARIESSSPTPHERTISPSTSEKDHSSSAKEDHGPTVEHVEIATMGSSSLSKSATRRVHRQRHRYQECTPIGIEKELLRSPGFHPTSIRAGSTVSSARSHSTAMQFEGILRSCEPSLVHLAPMLRNLGIHKIEHLKAIARLTPLIRDREVKENALRQGITVIEWAILLDKINTL